MPGSISVYGDQGGNIAAPRTPVGAIVVYTGSTVPVGWLACNGQSVSRDIYPALFAVIGTTFGSVDANSFNVPNTSVDGDGMYIIKAVEDDISSGGTGADGKSAYEIAVDNGFEGTEEEWLESLGGGGYAAIGGHAVIESWHEGTEWYRIWSDGWCEQGGELPAAANNTEATLHKPFADSNYTLLGASAGERETTVAVTNLILIYPKSSSTFVYRIRTYQNNNPSATARVNWYACGYVDLATVDTSKSISLGGHSVIETWHEGTEWYRVWSDGWLEQGGFVEAGATDQPNIDVTFEKAYTSIPSVIATNLVNQASTNSWGQSRYNNPVSDIAITGFKCSVGNLGNAGRGLVWEAKGYTDISDLISSASEDENGVTVISGKSAYELAVDNGYTGTESQWLDSLQGKNYLMGGFVQKIIVPENSTFNRHTDRHIVTSDIPTTIANSQSYQIESPFGNAICDVKVFLKLNNTWTYATPIYEDNKIFGVAASCPGDGYIYIRTGNYLNIKNSYSANTPPFNAESNYTSAEWAMIVTAPSPTAGAGGHSVIETWHEGTEWYRIWSDGWLEQGGDLSGAGATTSATRVLHKPFADTNYTVVISARGGRGTTGLTSTNVTATPSSVSQFVYRIKDGTSAIGATWYACGYTSVAAIEDGASASLFADTYSTEETKTHKVWIDGKPIYRKVLTYTRSAKTNFPANSWSTVAFDGLPQNMDTIVTQDLFGSAEDLGKESYKGLSRIYNGTFQVYFGSWAYKDLTLILEYTKTTD